MLYYEHFVPVRPVILPVARNANEKMSFTVHGRSSYLLLRLLERFFQQRQVNLCVDVNSSSSACSVTTLTLTGKILNLFSTT